MKRQNNVVYDCEGKHEWVVWTKCCNCESYHKAAYGGCET